MKPMKPMIPRTLGGLAASTLFVPCNLVAQTLTQHWKMDEPSLTYTASLAPIVNNGSLATAGALHNAGDIPNNPVAAQAGATAATGTSIRTRTRFQRIQLGNSSPTTGAFKSISSPATRPRPDGGISRPEPMLPPRNPSISAGSTTVASAPSSPRASPVTLGTTSPSPARCPPGPLSSTSTAS